MGARLITVTAAATNFDLTLLATVKDELKITGTADDATLSRYITGASQFLAMRCNRVFAQETVAETFRNGELLECLVLARRPVKSITSIVENAETLTTDDYELDDLSGLLYRLRNDCRSVWSWRKIVITHVAGYDLPDDAPSDLNDACIELVKMKISARTRDPTLRAVETPDVLREEFWVGGVGGQDGLPPRVLSVIESYRNVLV